MSEEEWDKENPSYGKINKDEKDVNVILSFLSKENSSNNRGNALLRLEKIAPELTLKKINLCIDSLIKIQDIETNPKIIDKINNLIKDFTNQLSRRSLHNIDAPKNNSVLPEMKDKSYSSGNAGFVLLIIGLILMLFGYAMSLDNEECILPDYSNQASTDAYQNCVEDSAQKVKDIATISILSSLGIFTGIGLMCRAILKNQNPPV